jgi:hypothetical protein
MKKVQFLAFYDHSRKHLERWFDFSDSNYLYMIQFLLLKKEPRYFELKDTVVVFKTYVNLDELCEAFCIIKHTLTVFVNNTSIKTLSFPDRCCQIVLAADSGLRNFGHLVSFLLSIPVCNAYVEQVFSIMNCYWRN